MKSDLDMNRLIERIRRLPLDKVREVYDFAGFLEGVTFHKDDPVVLTIMTQGPGPVF